MDSPLDIKKRIKELELQNEQLSKSNELYEKIFDLLPVGLHLFDKNGFSIRLNKKQKELLGISASTQETKPFNILTDPYTMSNGASKTYERAYKGEHFQHEINYELGIEENQWATRKENLSVKESIYPVFNDKGEVEYVLAQLEDITESKSDKKKLQQEEDRFKSFFHNSPAVMFILDPDTHFIIEANQAAVDFYGWSLEELKKLKIDDINTLSSEEIKNEIEKARFQKRIYFQFKHRLANGSLREVEVYSNGIYINNRMYLYSIVHDITERKVAEASLKEKTEEYYSLFEEYKAISEDLITSKELIEESEQHFRLLVENAPDAIFIQTNGNFTYLNKAAYKLYGIKDTDEIIDTPVLRIIHKDYHEIAKERIRKLNEEGEYAKSLEYKHQKIDGTEIHVDVSAVAFEFKKERSALVFVRDISSRKEIESEIAQRKLEFENFFNCALDLLCIADIEGKIVRMNKEWEYVLGYNNHELEGRNFFDFVHTEDIAATKEIVQKLSDQHKVLNFVNRYRCKNGKYKLLEWRSFPHGNIIYAAARDITEARKKNMELIQAKEKAEESERLKTAFLQNVSHEIRTPMNAIVGFSKMLNKKYLPEDKKEKFTGIIVQNSQQLLSIVDNIMSISFLETKQERLTISQINVNEIIDNLMTVFSPQAKFHNIGLQSAKGLIAEQADVFTDGIKLTQIMSNLITNALKFTPQGFIEFGYTLRENMLEFYVKDTGIGIEPELHEKIFERFRQAELSSSRKYGGNGLGLSISKGLVDLLDGHIWLESEPGKGSVFYISLPYFSANQINMQNPSIKLPEKELTILIADDEESNCLLIEEFLADYNYKLLFAKNGKEALDLCSHASIDIVFMDIKMPVMDGFSAAKLIKKLRPELPVIAQSAYAMDAEVRKYKEAFDDYLTKPINREKLSLMLYEHLKKSS